jgi:hypothetical protein
VRHASNLPSRAAKPRTRRTYAGTSAAAILPSPRAEPETLRLALVGGYAPRRCGLATFTTDIAETLQAFRPGLGLDVYVIDDPAQSMQYTKASDVICANDPASYRAAAAQINESGIDAVWIQHEFGIFGGESGEMICDFAEQIAAPLVFTLHTVLAEPSDVQRRIMLNLIARATRIMVTSKLPRHCFARLWSALDGHRRDGARRTRLAVWPAGTVQATLWP